jgi:hypothetical protein
MYVRSAQADNEGRDKTFPFVWIGLYMSVSANQLVVEYCTSRKDIVLKKSRTSLTPCPFTKVVPTPSFPFHPFKHGPRQVWHQQHSPEPRAIRAVDGGQVEGGQQRQSRRHHRSGERSVISSELSSDMLRIGQESVAPLRKTSPFRVRIWPSWIYLSSRWRKQSRWPKGTGSRSTRTLAT